MCAVSHRVIYNIRIIITNIATYLAMCYIAWLIFTLGMACNAYESHEKLFDVSSNLSQSDLLLYTLLGMEFVILLY